MDRLRLLSNSRAIAALCRRIAPGKGPEHNQGKERLIGPHRITLCEFRLLVIYQRLGYSSTREALETVGYGGPPGALWRPLLAAAHIPSAAATARAPTPGGSFRGSPGRGSTAVYLTDSRVNGRYRRQALIGDPAVDCRFSTLL